jgi:type II secretory pathway pseudopilin PulG
MKRFTGSRKYLAGFTLVELMIVTGVLATLISTVIVVINPVAQIEKTQDAHRKSDLNQIQKGLDLYYQDNGRYPANTPAHEINGAVWGSNWTPYLGKVPQDPVAGRTYVYVVSANGQSYWLYTNLAKGTSDPQACASGADCPNVPSANLCGGKACNYGVTSSDVSP